MSKKMRKQEYFIDVTLLSERWNILLQLFDFFCVDIPELTAQVIHTYNEILPITPKRRLFILKFEEFVNSSENITIPVELDRQTILLLDGIATKHNLTKTGIVTFFMELVILAAGEYLKYLILDMDEDKLLISQRFHNYKRNN